MTRTRNATTTARAVLVAFCSCLLLAALGSGCSSSSDSSEQQPIAGAPESESRTRPDDVPTAAGPRGPETEADASPAFASPAAAASGRPPYPAIPRPLVEPAPSQERVSSSGFRWLPGHWIWTGNEYQWQPGVWIYEVPGYELAPPRWVWDGEYWVFQDAGWTAAGETVISVRPSAAGGGDASAVPDPELQASEVDLYVAPSSHAVYVWTGMWLAPPIVYPNDRAPSDVDRYGVRVRPADPDPDPSLQSPQPPSDVGVVVGSGESNPAEEHEEDVELVPGVLHGGKRGEQERRLLEEQKQREAEREEGVDSVYVPYYYQPDYYYRRYPRRRPPVRPRPLPSPATPR